MQARFGKALGVSRDRFWPGLAVIGDVRIFYVNVNSVLGSRRTDRVCQFVLEVEHCAQLLSADRAEIFERVWSHRQHDFVGDGYLEFTVS